VARLRLDQHAAQVGAAPGGEAVDGEVVAVPDGVPAQVDGGVVFVQDGEQEAAGLASAGGVGGGVGLQRAQHPGTLVQPVVPDQ